MKENDINLQTLFSTPVWRSKINNYIDLNETLYQYIQNLKQVDKKGIDKSSIGGWHSPNFNLDDKDPRFFVNSINKSLNKAFTDMGWDVSFHKIKITEMWSIINKTGASNARHTHPNSFLSAAYYVKAPENCGDIKFYDPRSAPAFRRPKLSKDNILNATEISLIPEDGLLVLFPSWLHHSVKANTSEKERVVISFNIDLR
jgi:uncharacterized protein (TIGR02466 family)